MAIAVMIFGAMMILVGVLIFALIVWEYMREWRWLKSYLEKRK